ncbi:MAG: hypothetical protein H7144_10490 [Burkholderiales bacterium]|nr:hypothetical protein [Phycisphaerae bacterium]
MELKWADRRPIGALFPAGSSPELRMTRNPRGWFNDKSLDVTTPNGLALFRRRLLSYADFSVRILKAMNAQGVIVWDIEGQEHVEVTYVGDPRAATQMAPELDYLNVVDEFFKRFRDAGLRVGVTVRPQKLSFKDGKWRQETSDDPSRELIDKIAFAKNRWGATLFYIDSNDAYDTDSVKNAARAFPDILLIPEHEISRTYAYAAPYGEVRGDYVSTPRLVRDLYPGAFSIINVFDGNVAGAKPQLIEAVRRGDILLFQAWWANPNNPIVQAIYAAAAKQLEGVTP